MPGHETAAHLTPLARPGGPRNVSAATVTGICVSGISYYCLRDMPSGPVDLWSRDISGDSRQQWEIEYIGPSQNVSGCQGVDPGYGVYAFIGWNGYYLGAQRQGTVGGGPVFLAGDQGSYNSYADWIWESGGGLVNCGGSDQCGYLQLLANDGNYKQVSTDGSGVQWQQVHVS